MEEMEKSFNTPRTTGRWPAVLAVIVLLFASGGSRAADWFAIPAGGGTGTQANPCSLQVALDAASDGDVVYLGAGSYTGDGSATMAVVSHSVAVLGGWNGAATGQPARDPDAHPSILDGQGLYRVIFVYPGLTVTLDGLTIQNGQIQGNGAGVCTTASDLTVQNCRFLANYAHSLNSLDSYGGGLYAAGGKLTVRDSLFDQNDAWCEGCSSTYGGGISANAVANVVVERCEFHQNDAWLGCGLSVIGGAQDTLVVKDSIFRENGLGASVGSGYGGYAGGVYLVGVGAEVSGCHFKGNSGGNDAGAMRLAGPGLVAHVDRCWFLENASYRTPGIQVISGSLTLTNSVLARNQASGVQGGALSVDGEDAAAVADHVTFSENRAQGGGYAVRAENTAACSLENLIVAGHSVGLYAGPYTTISADGILWGTGAWANDAQTGGAGSVTLGPVSVSGDPAFVDPSGGDYHISGSSAAVDQGIDSGVHHDIDDQVRPIGAGVDLGADEYLPLPVVTTMSKVPNPFRINVNGSNLQSGVRVFINGTEWTNLKWKSASLLKIKGGASLKALVPKGVARTFRFVNPDGGEVTLTWQY